MTNDVCIMQSVLLKIGILLTLLLVFSGCSQRKLAKSQYINTSSLEVDSTKCQLLLWKDAADTLSVVTVALEFYEPKCDTSTGVALKRVVATRLSAAKRSRDSIVATRQSSAVSGASTLSESGEESTPVASRFGSGWHFAIVLVVAVVIIVICIKIRKLL